MKRALILGLLAWVVGAARPAWSWVRDGLPLWSDGIVTLHLELGSSPTYSDGSTPNTTARATIDFWNPYMGRVQLATVTDTRTPKGRDNYNNVFSSDTIYGDSFPVNALAVTMTWSSSSRRTESDVAVNKSYSWDSYRGPLSYGTRTYDLRRVLAHEIGHVLGLGHPDEEGQYVYALMNSTISDIDFTAQDDQDGVAALYGHGVANAPVPPSIVGDTPYDYVVTEGDSLTFSANVEGSQPMTFQWRKNGQNIAGATQLNYTINPVELTDAGKYSVYVANEAGSTVSREATLTVNPAQPPTIHSQPQSTSAFVGGSADFNVYASGTGSLSYQWFKDGVALDYAQYSWLSVFPVSAASAGDYTVTVTNRAGNATSDPAHLTVAPLPPPSVATLWNQTVNEGGDLWLSGDSYSPVPGQTYQWYHDGVPIPGAGGEYYQKYSATLADGGDYFVVITNATGSTTSLSAHVTIRPGSSAALGGWTYVRSQGGVAYFLFENPARIERFDIASDSFLSPINLGAAPTAMALNADGLFVAFGGSISRFALDGSNEVTLAEVGETITEMVEWSGTLYASYLDTNVFRDRLMSVDADTGEVIAITDAYWVGRGASVDIAGHVFSRSRLSSPSDICRTVLNGDGTFGSSTDSPYHGAFPDAARTFVFPDGTRVADDSGTIYATADLTYAGSLGGPLQDIVFRADGTAITLRNGVDVDGYDAGLHATGRLKLGSPANAIVIDEDELVAFTQPAASGGGILWQRISLSALSRGTPATAIDPGTLAYTPDGVWLDRTGSVLLYSRLHRNIFRWSVAEHRYLDSIGLLGAPNHVDYTALEHALYLAYADGTIRALRLSGRPSEEPFAATPLAARGLAIAGEYVLAITASAQISWDNRFTFSADGAVAAWDEGYLYSRSYVWNATKRRLYWLRDSFSSGGVSYIEIVADGTFGAGTNSPYDYGPTQLPIRISPNGDNVLLGSGRFLNADTLAQNNALANELEDAAWLGSTLFTGRTTLDGAEIQRWGGGNYGLDASKTLPGRFLRLFATGADRLLAVTMEEGRVFFTLFDPDLEVRSTTRPPSTARLLNLSTRGDCETGDNVLIPGFVIAGTGSKQLLIRAVGPTLASDPFNVPDVLPDPQITLKRLVNGAYVDVASNDNWSANVNAAEIRAAASRLFAFAIPDDSLDAALLVDLPPGQYTVVTSGVDDARGVGIVEFYDADEEESSGSRLINISTRGFVGTGARIMIPGLVVSPGGSRTVLLRAVGPTLEAAPFGVAGALADPKLTLFRSNGDGTSTPVLTQDNWGEAPDASNTAAVAAEVFAFALPRDSRDAATVVTLAPGAYTVQAEGADGGTGVVLVEVYDVP